MGEAAREITLAGAGITGPLFIGGSPLATNSILADAVARLTREGPAVDISMIEAADQDLERALIACEISFCVCTLTAASYLHPNILSEPLFTARMVAVVRQGHRLAHRSEISIQELSKELFAPPPGGSAFHYQIEALLTVNGLPYPRNIIRVEPFGVLKEIVKRTDGVTLLSDQIVSTDLREGTLVAIPLIEMPVPRVFGLRYLKLQCENPAASRCIEIIRQLGASYQY